MIGVRIDAQRSALSAQSRQVATRARSFHHLSPFTILLPETSPSRLEISHHKEAKMWRVWCMMPWYRIGCWNQETGLTWSCYPVGELPELPVPTAQIGRAHV